jgi:hypothetical protein
LTWNDRQVAEALSSVQNKIGEVVGNPFVRNIIGQWKPTIDMDRLLAERKILIARVPKGTLGGDQANLVGSMLVSAMLQAAMRREGVDGRPPFHLYIDEFQNFTTNSLATILSEARKWSLSLTIGHQFIAQLSDPIADAVFGNVGNIVAFRVGAEDADRLSREFGDLPAHQFRDLERGEIRARIMNRGEVLPPIAGRTWPELEALGYRSKVVAKSRRTYTRPRRKVEANLARWLEK